jgi:hypothetical protein
VGRPTPGGPFDCMRIMFILIEIRVQGTIYILIGTLLDLNTYFTYHLVPVLAPNY